MGEGFMVADVRSGDATSAAGLWAREFGTQARRLVLLRSAAVKPGIAALALVAAILATTGCSRKPAAVDPDCVAFVEKILKCDPSAPPSMRAEPEKFCPANRRSCGSKDVSTPAGCGQFMGCLYDGE